jgi:hypothetical protein
MPSSLARRFDWPAWFDIGTILALPMASGGTCS